MRTGNECPFRCTDCMPVGQDEEWFRKAATSRRIPKRVRVLFRDRDSSVLLLAPHGGNIEPHTEEIAGRVANILGCNCYCLCSGHSGKGRRASDGTDGHHIKSERIQAPFLDSLIQKMDVAVSVHGYPSSRVRPVEVGGLNRDLADDIVAYLIASGTSATRKCKSTRQGESSSNIVNRCKGQGVQLEIPRRWYRMPKARKMRMGLASAIANALHESLREPDNMKGTGIAVLRSRTCIKGHHKE